MSDLNGGRAFMRIVGERLLCDDGVTRPILEATVRGVGGQPYGDRFLVDSGADRTVLGADLLHRLQIPADPSPASFSLLGIGGGATFALVNAVIEVIGDDGRPATVRGEFAAFTDPQATDFSILGRDVLDNFDVILSRRRNDVLLLAPVHRYDVMRT